MRVIATAGEINCPVIASRARAAWQSSSAASVPGKTFWIAGVGCASSQ